MQEVRAPRIVRFLRRTPLLAETAGLIASLALGGMSLRAIRHRSPGALLVPLLIAIPIVNMLAWALGRLLPSWGAITAGYQLTATKT